ncbi:MAG: site-2 protease family protein [Chloroflexota bacterium]
MQRFSAQQILVLALVAFLFLYQAAPGLLRDPELLLVRVVAIILAITVHEFNHAFVAYLLGDMTAKHQGRLSLNPLRHLDPMGTVLLFIAQFGWGKPVPYVPSNLRVNPALGSALVSLAGPLANVLLAMVLFTPFRSPVLGEMVNRSIVRDLLAVNVGLAAFNLIPIPPLDGYGVVSAVFPRQFEPLLRILREYGLFILMALLFLPSFGGPDVIGSIMGPLQRFILALVTWR